MGIGVQTVFLELAETKELELDMTLRLFKDPYLPIRFPASPPCFFVLNCLLFWSIPAGLVVGHVCRVRKETVLKFWVVLG